MTLRIVFVRDILGTLVGAVEKDSVERGVATPIDVIVLERLMLELSGTGGGGILREVERLGAVCSTVGALARRVLAALG